MIKRLANWLGLLLLSKENKSKLRQHEAMMRACTDVYDWCGADFPVAAEAAEYVRTRALGYEGREGHNQRIMSPYQAHKGINEWREEMRRKYKKMPELDFDGKEFAVKPVTVN